MSLAQSISIQTLQPTIGAVIEGFDARRELNADDLLEFRGLLAKHKVVVLRNNELDLESQERFTAQFGTPWYHPVAHEYPDYEWLTKSGGVTLRAESWHADATFVDNPPQLSFLRLARQPPVGGDTLFADLQAAYDDLPASLRQLFESLTVIHDGTTFLPWTKGPSLTDARRAELYTVTTREVEHPLVHTHPVSGKKSLYAPTAFGKRIKGWSNELSDGLLALIYGHVTRPEYIARQKWQRGDLVIWDNRLVLHRASNDWGTAERKLQRTTVNTPAGA